MRLTLALQAWAVCVCAASGLVAGWQVGVSAATGGLICWLPSCWFAYRAFRHRGARAARQIVNGFYAAEAGKILLTMAAFAIVFARFPEVQAPALFIGYVGVQTIHWIAPLWAGRRESGHSSR